MIIASYHVEVALRLMRGAGARFELARAMVRDARKHRAAGLCVSAMVKIAREINHRAVATARAAREWLQP